MTAVTSLEHVYPAVGCLGRNSRRPGPDWCRRPTGERRNWLLPLGNTAVQGCWMLTRSPGFHRQEISVVIPVDMLVVEVADILTGVWEHWDGC